MTQAPNDPAPHAPRWARGQKFALSVQGRSAVAAYRSAIAGARASTGRGAFEAACADWARTFALRPEDGMYLVEVASKSVTLAELGEALAICSQSRADVARSIQRLFDAGLVTLVRSASVLHEVVTINGLPLPGGLVRAMREDRWRPPTHAAIHSAFREHPIRCVFYDLTEMRKVNERWLTETDPAFVGHPDKRVQPGDIDRSRSVLLGALGPDLPFALDYRVSLEEPSVVYLHSGGDRWVRVAHHIDDLLARLRLNGRARS